MKQPYDKVPPHATDVEEAVLGACMIESSAFPIAREMINADVFYSDKNRTIFQALEELFSENTPIDLITVSSRLSKMGKIFEIGGPFTLTQMTNRVAGGAHIDSHCRILLQSHFKRELISIGSDLIKNGYDSSVDALEMLSGASTMIDNIYAYVTGSKQMSFLQQLNDTVDNIEVASKSDRHILGLATGFKYRDLLTSGRCKGTLAIIAGRPGQGKTAALVQEVLNMCKQGIPVAVFSLEMSVYELIIRMMANLLRRDSNAIRNGKVPMDEIRQSAAILAKHKIYIYDASQQSILQIKARAKILKKKYGIEAIYVDYLQLAEGNKEKGGTREREVASVSTGLKAIAKDLQIAVIALAQIGRGVEGKGNSKRPELSDLKESGQIEADADVVEMLYRDEYYGILEDENGNSTKDICECAIKKNRSGGIGMYKTKFLRQFSIIEEISLPEVEKYYNPNQHIEPNRDTVTF